MSALNKDIRYRYQLDLDYLNYLTFHSKFWVTKKYLSMISNRTGTYGTGLCQRANFLQPNKILDPNKKEKSSYPKPGNM